MIKYQRLKAHFILALSNPLSLISPVFYLLHQSCLTPDGFEGGKKMKFLASYQKPNYGVDLHHTVMTA